MKFTGMIASGLRTLGNGVKNAAVGIKQSVVKGDSKRVAMLAVVMVACVASAAAQSLSGTDYTAGTTALETVATQVAAYVPYVVNLCYAIAGVVAIVGAISVYIAMNNEEQDVKKKIMMVVGACIFLVAAAQALPLFFGL